MEKMDIGLSIAFLVFVSGIFTMIGGFRFESVLVTSSGIVILSGGVIGIIIIYFIFMITDLMTGQKKRTSTEPYESVKMQLPKMLFCTSCGSNIDVDSHYCDWCGSRVEQ